ncbi:hypothetical protein KKD70_00380 [Patescibacteria group bacterium]|nr:hypothetical protein [Patescibacteria group bacterium]
MKKIIIVGIGAIILFGGIFLFTNSSQTGETQEQAVLASTLNISREYAALRYQTDNVLMNAENYADYDAWNNEMSLIIEKWGNLEKESCRWFYNARWGTPYIKQKIGFNITS